MGRFTNAMLGGAIAASCLAAVPAMAADSCKGTYMTSVMQPMAQPVTVATVSDPRNPELSAQFEAGLAAGGAKVDASSPLRLNVIFTLATPGAAGQAFNNFNWATQGGANANVQGGAIEVTAQVMDTNSYAYLWIASFRCTIQTPDAGSLAGDLGRLVGSTMGKSVPTGRM